MPKFPRFGFGFKTISPEELAMKLKTSSKETKELVFDRTNKYTYELRDIARAMTPRKFGNLEEAIITKINRNQYDKATYSVVVQDIINGVDVSAYMLYIHENRYAAPPHGWVNLGPRSVEKDAASPYRVGEKFMDRALEVKKKEILKELNKILINGMQNRL